MQGLGSDRVQVLVDGAPVEGRLNNQFDLTRIVLDSGSKTTGEAVDYLLWRMLRVPTSPTTREACIAFLTKELATESLDRARTYMEDPLRMTVHLIMSTPEYQLV